MKIKKLALISLTIAICVLGGCGKKDSILNHTDEYLKDSVEAGSEIQSVRYTVYDENSRQYVTYVSDDGSVRKEIMDALKNAKVSPSDGSFDDKINAQLTLCGVTMDISGLIKHNTTLTFENGCFYDGTTYYDISNRTEFINCFRQIMFTGEKTSYGEDIDSVMHRIFGFWDTMYYADSLEEVENDIEITFFQQSDGLYVFHLFANDNENYSDKVVVIYSAEEKNGVYTIKGQDEKDEEYVISFTFDSGKIIYDNMIFGSEMME